MYVSQYVWLDSYFPYSLARLMNALDGGFVVVPQYCRSKESVVREASSGENSGQKAIVCTSESIDNTASVEFLSPPLLSLYQWGIKLPIRTIARREWLCYFNNKINLKHSPT